MAAFLTSLNLLGQIYLRQSSTTRVNSGQIGIASAAVPDVSTVKRPRLNAIWSSRLLLDCTRAVIKGGLPPLDAGSLRCAAVVRISICAFPCACPARDRVTLRCARSHCTMKSAWRPAVPNKAVDPRLFCRYVQSPGVIGQSRQSPDAGATGAGAGVGVTTTGACGCGCGAGAGGGEEDGTHADKAMTVVRAVIFRGKYFCI